MKTKQSFSRNMRRKTNVISKNGRHARDDAARMALEGMRSYYAARPSSPAAVRRPALSFRRGLWIALLGPSVEEGIVGIGSTVEAALRAFDAQYLAGLRPPSECHRHQSRLKRRVCAIFGEAPPNPE